MATRRRSKTTEEERDSDNSDDISKSIQMLSQVKEDMDEADIIALMDILVSFSWNDQLQKIVKSHLQINKKKPGGSGRGYSKEKQLEESIKLLLENENKLTAKMCSDLKGMVSLREKQLEDAIHLLVENEEKLTEKMHSDLKEMIFLREKSLSEKKNDMSVIEKTLLAKKLGESESSHLKNSMGKYPCASLEDLDSVDTEDYYKLTNSVLVSFLSGIVKTDRAKAEDKPMWKITVIEISDRIKKLCSVNFLSPIGVARNYFLMKTTGSKMCVNILGATDGSGTYNTLHRIEQATADSKNIQVLPMDVRLTAGK